MPRVALLLKITPAQPMKLAGALVLHGLSSGQAMDVIRLLATKDVVLNLTGTLRELNTTFNPHGLVVEDRTPPHIPIDTGDPNIQPLNPAE